VEQVQQYVGIDLHRRRSVIVRRTESGETLDTVRIDNDPVTLAAERSSISLAIDQDVQVIPYPCVHVIPYP
jgi:hypothetical protein